jgi:hypothetical protein
MYLFLDQKKDMSKYPIFDTTRQSALLLLIKSLSDSILKGYKLLQLGPLMFIEKGTSAPKDLRIKFWQREYGTLWLPFERKRINEFSNVKPNQRITITGYVKWITNSVFALLPTVFSNQIYLVCINYTDERPPENAYITVSGMTKFDKLRPQSKIPPSIAYKATLTLHVQDWIQAKPNLEIPKINMDYINFKSELTARIEGLEPQIEDFLAFTAISTPTFSQNAGGINVTLYDSTANAGLPKIVAKELSRVIPEDFADLHSVSTSFGRFALRYKYSFFSEDADKPLTLQLEDLLTHNTSRFMPDVSEASLSLFSAKTKPKKITDPACSLSDIPTVIPEQTSLNKLKRGIDQFDALNFIVINHMKTPIVKDLQATQTMLVNKLEKLTDSWGLNPEQLTKYGFLNASYSAKPASIIRESLSLARAQNIQIVTPDLVSKVFDEYFKWNFEYVNEVWVDLLSKPITNRENLASMNIKYRDIIRIIRRIQSTGEPGARKEDIIRESKMNLFEVEEQLSDCLKEGIIYEPTPGTYKLTYG